MALSILELRDLKKHFVLKRSLLSRTGRLVKAVDGVSLKLNQGESLGLVGESGCGKSTTGRMILQTIRPTAGEVLFKGRDLAQFDRRDLKAFRRSVQMVFQDCFASLNPRMRVADIIGEALDVHGVARTKPERREIIAGILDDVGLKRDWGRRYPHEFSGGQRQRVGLARALCLRPEVIVCDEPVSALDVSIQAQILNLMKDIQRRYGLAYLFISHDLKVVKHVSDRVAVMYLGRIVEQSPTKELFASPRHPYAKLLISVIPNPDPRIKRRRVPVRGEATGQGSPDQGCLFAPRCDEAEPRCALERPPLVEVAKDHLVACHLIQPQP